MNLHALPANDMRCANPSHGERVGDKRTVAPPGHRFRAHDRGRFLLRQFDQSLQALPEFRRLHVIGEAPKRSVAPTQVRRIAPRVAQAAQQAQMDIAYPGAAQLRRERLPIELRIVPRSGNAAHVCNTLDPMSAQEFQKLRPRARGVPDREYGEHS